MSMPSSSAAQFWKKTASVFKESIAFAEDTVFVVEFLPHAKSIHGGDLDYEYKNTALGRRFPLLFSIKKFRDGIESSQRIEAVSKRRILRFQWMNSWPRAISFV